MFSIKTAKPLGTVMLAAALLWGCKPTEEVKTADWYQANLPEMEKMITKCRDNPGELDGTPNCKNAEAARQRDLARQIKEGGAAPRIEYKY